MGGASYLLLHFPFPPPSSFPPVPQPTSAPFFALCSPRLALFAHLPYSHQCACAFPSLLRTLQWLSGVSQEKAISLAEHAGNCWLFLISSARVTAAPVYRPACAQTCSS